MGVFGGFGGGGTGGDDTATAGTAGIDGTGVGRSRGNAHPVLSGKGGDGTVIARANAGVTLTASPACAGSVAFSANPAGGYDQIANFTGSGCLTIADGDPTVTLVDYLVVVGGGGGGGITCYIRRWWWSRRIQSFWLWSFSIKSSKNGFHYR